MLIPVDGDRAALIATGHVEPVVAWVEKDGRRQPGDQENDEGSGLPLWTVHALIVGDTRPPGHDRRSRPVSRVPRTDRARPGRVRAPRRQRPRGPRREAGHLLVRGGAR